MVFIQKLHLFSVKECRKELLESVAEILKETSEEQASESRDVFKIPHVITSYFAPTAKTRIVGGNAFQASFILIREKQRNNKQKNTTFYDYFILQTESRQT